MEVIRTPRTGTGLTHRMLVLFSMAGNFTVSKWQVNASQARATSEPALNAWAAQLLPDPAKVSCRVEYPDRTTGKILGSTDVPLAVLQLSPLDVVYMSGRQQGAQRGELEERVLNYVARTQKVPSNADVRLNYAAVPETPGNNVSFGALVEVARTVRALLAQSRALDARDLSALGDKVEIGVNVADLTKRATAAQLAFTNSLAALQAGLTSAKSSSTASLDDLLNALLRPTAFGIPL